MKRPAALSWEVRDSDARGQGAAVIQAAVLAGLRRGRCPPTTGAVLAKSGIRLQLQHLIMTLRHSHSPLLHLHQAHENFITVHLFRRGVVGVVA